MADVRDEASRSGSLRRWILGAAVAAAVTAVLTAPTGTAGVCPSNADCQVWATNTVAIPVPEWLWLVAVPVVFVGIIVVGALRRRV